MTSPRELAHAREALTTALTPYLRREALARPLAEWIAILVDEMKWADSLDDVAAALTHAASSDQWETARILEEIAMHLHQRTLRKGVQR